MRYDRKMQQQRQLDVRIFRLIFRDYLVCRQRHLTSALPHLEKSVACWLDRIGGMSGKW